MTDQRTQFVAVGLIVFGAVCIALGSAMGWHDLVLYAINAGGVGSGILTGRYLAKSEVNTSGGDVVLGKQ